MWSDMAVTGGLAALKAGMSYREAQQDAEAKKAWQAYKNAMTQLANANNQNTLTTNENLAKNKFADQEFAIARSEYLTQGTADVAAAASGTAGRSVNAVQFDIERNAASARGENQKNLDAEYLTIDAQREASAFQAATQTDYSPIPEPNGVAAMLGFGVDLGKIYNRYNPT